MNQSPKYSVPQFKNTFQKKQQGSITSKPFVFSETRNSWNEIIAYLRTLNGIRKSICGGCGSAKLYDKNNVRYTVTRLDTLDKAKSIVDQIKKVNQSDV